MHYSKKHSIANTPLNLCFNIRSKICQHIQLLPWTTAATVRFAEDWFLFLQRKGASIRWCCHAVIQHFRYWSRLFSHSRNKLWKCHELSSIHIVTVNTDRYLHPKKDAQSWILTLCSTADLHMSINIQMQHLAHFWEEKLVKSYASKLKMQKKQLKRAESKHKTFLPNLPHKSLASPFPSFPNREI